jgi:hypothetical protein
VLRKSAVATAPAPQAAKATPPGASILAHRIRNMIFFLILDDK